MLDPAASFASATVLLAVDGTDSAVGMVVLTAPGSDGAREVKRLWVKTAARRTGVAAALMDGALRRAAEDGTLTVRLSVWLWRGRAIALYRGLGFETVPSWDDRPGLLCLEKTLRGPGATPLDGPTRIERIDAARIRAHASEGLAGLLVDAVEGEPPWGSSRRCAGTRRPTGGGRRPRRRSGARGRSGRRRAPTRRSSALSR